jgi:hypothetical protein
MKNKVFVCWLCLLFGCISYSSFGDNKDTKNELSSWLQKNPQGKAYQNAEENLNRVIESTEKEGLPTEILMTRMREGAAKKIPEDLLVNALNEELDRLVLAKTILQNEEIQFSSKGAYQDALREISLLLLNGFSGEFVSGLLTFSVSQDKGIEGVLAAGCSLLLISGTGHLSEEQLYNLGKALLSSRFSPAGYPSVASLFIKASVNQVEPVELLAPVIRILEQGGGLIQLERELRRRMKRR